MATRILIVDDELSNLRLLARRLRADGWEVTTVSHGSLGLRALRETEFDTMLTDIDMPEVTGIELLRAAATIAPRMRRLAMTGGIETSVAFAAGAQVVLSKPFDHEQLRAALAAAASPLARS